MSDYDTRLDQFFEDSVDERQVEAATAFRTGPTGAYNVQFDSVKPYIGENEKIESTLDRVMVSCAANLYEYTDGNEAPRKLGRVFGELSPETRTWESGDMDTPSKLWGQAIKALIQMGALPGDKETGKVTEKISNRAVVQALAEAPFRIYVTERYKDLETGKYVSLKEGDQEARAAAKTAGYTLSNRLVSISRYTES